MAAGETFSDKGLYSVCPAVMVETVAPVETLMRSQFCEEVKVTDTDRSRYIGNSDSYIWPESRHSMRGRMVPPSNAMPIGILVNDRPVPAESTRLDIAMAYGHHRSECSTTMHCCDIRAGAIRRSVPKRSRIETSPVSPVPGELWPLPKNIRRYFAPAGRR